MDIVDAYHALIVRLLSLSGESDTVLHIHAGLAIYFGTQLLMRDRRSSLPALVMVALIELANEVMDRLSSGSWNWPDTLHDIFSTLFWPVTIYLVHRYRRHLWQRQAERRAKEVRALFKLRRFGPIGSFADSDAPLPGAGVAVPVSAR